jgi:hypothetical protein
MTAKLVLFTFLCEKTYKNKTRQVHPSTGIDILPVVEPNSYMQKASAFVANIMIFTNG